MSSGLIDHLNAVCGELNQLFLQTHPLLIHWPGLRFTGGKEFVEAVTGTDYDKRQVFEGMSSASLLGAYEGASHLVAKHYERLGSRLGRDGRSPHRRR